LFAFFIVRPPEFGQRFGSTNKIENAQEKTTARSAANGTIARTKSAKSLGNSVEPRLASQLSATRLTLMGLPAQGLANFR